MILFKMLDCMIATKHSLSTMATTISIVSKMSCIMSFLIFKYCQRCKKKIFSIKFLLRFSFTVNFLTIPLTAQQIEHWYFAFGLLIIKSFFAENTLRIFEDMKQTVVKKLKVYQNLVKTGFFENILTFVSLRELLYYFCKDCQRRR